MAGQFTSSTRSYLLTWISKFKVSAFQMKNCVKSRLKLYNCKHSFLRSHHDWAIHALKTKLSPHLGFEDQSQCLPDQKMRKVRPKLFNCNRSFLRSHHGWTIHVLNTKLSPHLGFEIQTQCLQDDKMCKVRQKLYNCKHSSLHSHHI